MPITKKCKCGCGTVFEWKPGDSLNKVFYNLEHYQAFYRRSKKLELATEIIAENERVKRVEGVTR